MIIVTRDYSSGTSAAVLDYKAKNVLVVTPSEYRSAFELNGEDIFFIGHDFLSFLWDSAEKINYWKRYRGRKIVWCFERVLSIVPEWRSRGLDSYQNVTRFANRIFVSDEEDATTLNRSWLPQWPSPLFYINRDKIRPIKKILFTGQAGSVGYEKRDALLRTIVSDNSLSNYVNIISTSRTLTWTDYVKLLLSHHAVLCPAGNIAAFNTRTYETITSGRIAIQQVAYPLARHQISIVNKESIEYFVESTNLKTTFENALDRNYEDPTETYMMNNLYSRVSLVLSTGGDSGGDFNMPL
jgi:hypothetical protein